MDEFPDPDEVFDLIHAEEFEALKELEDEEENFSSARETAKVTPSIDLTKSKKSSSLKENFDSTRKSKSKSDQELLFSSQNTENQSFENNNTEKQANISNVNGETKKRTVDRILQDISLEFDPLSLEDFDSEFNVQLKKKPRWDEPEELMKLILEKRNQGHQNFAKIKNNQTSYNHSENMGCISKNVPRWNFIAVTKSTGERLYVKLTEENKFVPEKKIPSSGFLTTNFSKLKEEAEEIMVHNSKRASIQKIQIQQSTSGSKIRDGTLWVDKYRPKKYMELLTDESVNKALLYWLKLWDKIVFGRDPTVRSKTSSTSLFNNKFKKQDIPEHDSKGFPTHRIALLSGPPGLGKTTLAHVAVRHAGYNIVELNASDDRGPEAFREALTSSTQMRAVVDKEKRPNCLILDEIDGAPTASIDLLLKFVQGKLAPKGKKAKQKEKDGDGCRRPIICICNDVYTPSLRPLRTSALLINVPEVSVSVLTERLQKIVQKEKLNVDSRTLFQLAERSGCDVRSCLGMLQYTGGDMNMLKNLSLGLKDTKKGLFESYRDILKVPMTRHGILTDNERVKIILRIVQQGETDRLVQGVFHNYPEVCKDKIFHISKSLEWFQFYDEVTTLIMERQSWMLLSYTNYAFITWHLYLSSSQNPKISFPTKIHEVNQKLERNIAVLTIIKKYSKSDILTLTSDILPFLPDILNPKLRSVNPHIYSSNEKAELIELINVMLDFGLTFVQEKKPEGGYEYVLDPNIWDIAIFPDCKTRKFLSYAVKQIVIQELEVERLKRNSVTTSACTNSNQVPDNSTSNKTSATPVTESVETTSSTQKTDNVPNHLRQLNPIQLNTSPKCRNFFSKFQEAGKERFRQMKLKKIEEGFVEEIAPTIPEKTDMERKKEALKCDVWYQYKEGYSNAVRRTVLIRELL